MYIKQHNLNNKHGTEGEILPHSSDINSKRIHTHIEEKEAKP